MPKLYISSVINAPVQSVWDYIRDFNSLPKWFPGVTDSKIESGMRSDQIGCIRDFGLEGGPRIREQLLAFSDQDHSCRYKMLSGPLPLSNYVASVRLFPVTDGNQTFAEISSEFDCAREQESELSGFLSNTYQGAFDILKHHVGK
jgi:polyketide cyclase/dehydrase/lipid transport protein